MKPDKFHVIQKPPDDAPAPAVQPKKEDPAELVRESPVLATPPSEKPKTTGPVKKKVKAQLVTVNNKGVVYTALKFVCPGCVAGGPQGYDGLHLLPVNTNNHEPSWTWDGNLDAPTLGPSILTRGYSVCHSYLEKGKFRFLEDSTHSLSGKSDVPMPDLPDWAVETQPTTKP